MTVLEKKHLVRMEKKAVLKKHRKMIPANRSREECKERLQYSITGEEQMP